MQEASRAVMQLLCRVRKASFFAYCSIIVRQGLIIHGFPEQEFWLCLSFRYGNGRVLCWSKSSLRRPERDVQKGP